jgi:hypothetical protein
MLDLNASSAHVLRAVLLPLDCSRRQLKQLLAPLEDFEGGVGKRLDEYGVEAVELTGGPEEPPVVESFREIATFATMTALRVEFADPLRGTQYIKQYPEYSSERRMMTRPLRKHPGLSRFGENVRNQYVYDVLNTFQNRILDSLQREIVAALLVPDSERTSTPRRPARTYISDDESLESLHSRYATRVTKCDDGFKVPLGRVSARTFVEPVADQLYLSSLDLDNLKPMIRGSEHLFVPTKTVLVRLANYASHSWYRLVNLAYQLLSDRHIQEYVRRTPRVRKVIQDHLNFRKPIRSFVPFYGAVSENPLADLNSKDPISRPDKRLITVADTIRGRSAFEFDESISLTELFDEICRFFPSPERPSNDVTDRQTLENALEGAIDDQFTTSETTSSCEVPAPKYTPFFPRTRKNPWDQYRHHLATLASESLTLPSSDSISPVLPEAFQPCQSTEYAAALQRANQAAACKAKYDAARVETVRPLVDPSDIDGLSAAELLFLTRIGLAMERRIRSYSLTKSMASFRDLPDGSTLNIDIEGLKKRDLLSQPKMARTYYSVPWDVKQQLDIPNVSHDGWGEQSPSEKTLHRVGVDLVAFLFASRPDVEHVVRYCDVWRLQPTACWDGISHLSKKRLDVVGFSGNEPVVVAEIETDSGDAAEARGTVEKLDAFPPHVDRYLIAPNGNHIPMPQLSEMEQFDINVSRRERGGYRPAEVRTKLEERGTISDVITNFFTYYNVRERLPDQFNEYEFTDRIVGAI